jgi:DNA (cytosine-5)-methyltransferase 1
MSVIDLFSGCGGMSLGFMNAGFDVVAAFDHWKPAIEVYRRNFSHPIFEYDLGNYDKDCAIFKQFNSQMIIGGPPCQDFSSAGKRDESLGRAELTVSFAEIVAAIKPKWFVMENVGRAEKSRALASAKLIFNKAGYGLSQKVLDASLCGVPQQRKRLFIVGELGGEDDSVLPYLEKNLSHKPMTLREYLGKRIDVEFYYRHPRTYKRRAIFSINEPSPTIRGVNRPVPNGYPGHSGDPVKISAKIRPLTTKERSLIQTFPENFEFVGTKTHVEQLIGNAVPVKLAEYVAKCVSEYIQDEKPIRTPRKENAAQQKPAPIK